MRTSDRDAVVVHVDVRGVRRPWEVWRRGRGETKAGRDVRDMIVESTVGAEKERGGGLWGCCVSFSSVGVLRYRCEQIDGG